MQTWQDHREQAQLIHDKETGEYLKYRQLMHDPKYKGTCQQSAANEFGRLTQGVGGRYKGTNTIFFIHKNQVPHDRMKDVMYGSFSCSYKPNKTEKERTYSRRRQNKLPRRCRHTNCGHACIQSTNQQSGLNRRSRVFNDRHQRFLSQHTHEMLWINVSQDARHPGRNNQRT